MAEAAEAEKAQARLEEMANMSNARREALKRLEENKDMPIDEMPDCPFKLSAIRE